MKKFSALLVAITLLLSPLAHADTFRTLPGSSINVVFDTTLGTVYGIGPNGTGLNGLTVLPTAATNTTWSGTNNFTGTFKVNGNTMSFPGSAATLAGLGIAQTWSAVQTYTNSDIKILGSSTGGTVITSDNAGASNFTMHLPAANDTLATIAGAQNLTNKTVTNPVIVGPAPVACGATCSPTSGSLTTFAVNSGGTASLPTSSGSGNVYRFRTMITQSSSTIKILLTTTSDVIIGTAIGENSGTAKIFVGNAATNHSIAMPFAGTQPSGGFAGDDVVCTDMAVGTYACDIRYQAGTTPTTPYSTSTT